MFSVFIMTECKGLFSLHCSVLPNRSRPIRTMTSDGSATPHEVGCESSSRIYQTSLGKNVVFPSIYRLHLLCITFGRKDFVLFSKLIQ